MSEHEDRQTLAVTTVATAAPPELSIRHEFSPPELPPVDPYRRRCDALYYATLLHHRNAATLTVILDTAETFLAWLTEGADDESRRRAEAERDALAAEIDRDTHEFEAHPSTDECGHPTLLRNVPGLCWGIAADPVHRTSRTVLAELTTPDHPGDPNAE